MKQTVTYILIFILAGLLVWTYLNKDKAVIVEPDPQAQAREAKAVKVIDSLKGHAQKLKHKLTTDSLKRSQENSQKARIINNLNRQIVELKAGLSDSTLTKEQVIDKQDAVIGLQDKEIGILRERIFNDSLHLAEVHRNFEVRLSLSAQENDQLKEIISIRDDTITERDSMLHKQKKRSTIKSVIIIALALARVLI